MEERLAQKQPDGTSGEGSVDLEPPPSPPDWSCNDFDDAIQANGGQSSPHLFAESHKDADENEEAVARLSSDSCNESAMQIEAPPTVPTAFMSNVSSAMAVPSLPDLQHSDRCVEKGLTPSKTGSRLWLTDS